MLSLPLLVCSSLAGTHENAAEVLVLDSGLHQAPFSLYLRANLMLSMLTLFLLQ